VAFAHVLTLDVTVKVSRERAWHYFNKAAGWPSWHTDVAAVELTPAGEIGPRSTATLRLRKGPASRYRVTAFAPPEHWAWHTTIGWLTMEIEHRFEVIDATTTRISLVHRVGGVGRSLIARLLAKPIAASLVKDLPKLEAEMNERA
jgi:hypothetical protein